MEKPLYDLNALLQALEICDKNIKAFEGGIEREKERKKEYLFYIKEHKRYQEYLENK